MKKVQFLGQFFTVCFDGYRRKVWEYMTATGEKFHFWTPKKLLGLNSSAKTAKGLHDIYILYLRPAAGNILGIDVCPHRTPECTDACLGNTSGRMVMSNVQRYQHNKTLLYLLRRKEFINILYKDILRAIKRSKRTGVPFAVRLNGTSDVSWNSVIKNFPTVQFYDYTKNVRRAKRNLFSGPENYHLTLSFDGYNWVDCLDYLDNGGNVAIVFKDRLPATYKGYKVIDADKYDNRALDPPGTIAGLSVKGLSKQDLSSPFFVDPNA